MYCNTKLIIIKSGYRKIQFLNNFPENLILALMEYNKSMVNSMMKLLYADWIF